MTASTEGTREWTLQQLRQRADAEVPGATERKVHTALGPDGVLVMAYCRDEGLEIVADMLGGALAMQVNGDLVTSLIERASSGDRYATGELEARFSSAQLAALAGVMDIVTASPRTRPRGLHAVAPAGLDDSGRRTRLMARPLDPSWAVLPEDRRRARCVLSTPSRRRIVRPS